MNVLIIEDEPRAANRLERLINKIAPEFDVVGQTDAIKDSILLLESRDDIQLIFSDIELGDGTSFEIFRKVNTQIPIIFTTAYNQYAIEAFKVNGVDYLLKPIDESELAQAIEKFKRNFQNRAAPDISTIIEAIANIQSSSKRSRFLVKVGEKLKSIPTSDIAAFYSMAKGTFILTKSGRNYSIEQALDQLIQELDDSQFFKISRKYIVAVDALDEILVHSNSRLLLKIKGLESQDVVVAREKVKEFKTWLG